MHGQPGMPVGRYAGMRPGRLRACHSCSNLTPRRAGSGISEQKRKIGTAVHLAPCRTDGAHHAAPAPCRQPRTEHQTCPGICKPHRCTVRALIVPAKRHLRKSVPTRPCFVNPGFGTAARHTSPGRLGLKRRNRRSQRFSPARCAFLARQNRRARRSSTLVPAPRGAPRPACA